MSTRRDFLKTSGLLVVSATALSLDAMELLAQGQGPYPDPDFRQLDSWIVIREDNTATFFVGKTDLGQGTGTAFRQLMADELDMPYERTTCVMGSTDVTPDQGGSGQSHLPNGIYGAETNAYSRSRCLSYHRADSRPSRRL